MLSSLLFKVLMALALNQAVVDSGAIVLLDDCRVYACAADPSVSVYDRLTADAIVRRTIPKKASCNEGAACCFDRSLSTSG
jgi:hypothetical protein